MEYLYLKVVLKRDLAVAATSAVNTIKRTGNNLFVIKGQTNQKGIPCIDIRRLGLNELTQEPYYTTEGVCFEQILWEKVVQAICRITICKDEGIWVVESNSSPDDEYKFERKFKGSTYELTIEVVFVKFNHAKNVMYTDVKKWVIISKKWRSTKFAAKSIAFDYDKELRALMQEINKLVL